MPFISNESFENYVKGKSVALVGPAASASEIKQGDKIDAYDFVARIKTPYVSPEKRSIYGSRTDFLYTTDLSIDDVLPGDLVFDIGTKRSITTTASNMEVIKGVLRNEVKAIISTYPKEEWFFHRFTNAFAKASNEYNIRLLPPEPYMTVRKITNRPNSGFSAILDICSLPFSEIYITGIDFYRSMYRDGYVNSLWQPDVVEQVASSFDGVTPDGTPCGHNPDEQFKYFKYNIYEKDKRVSVDKNLEHFLSDTKYENFRYALGINN